MAIDATHPSYDANIQDWTLIDNVIKRKNLHSYLLALNPADSSSANQQRNDDYKKRAVFYALSFQTLIGMLGLAFSRPPRIALPTQLEYLVDNVDGAGNTLEQQSKGVLSDVASKGRAGLFTSFPMTDGPISRADVDSKRYVATIQQIDAKQIINWRVETFNAEKKLTLVVIADAEEVVNDYKVTYVPIIRELYLDAGIYRERHWRKVDDSWTYQEYTPTNSTGQLLTEIPFTFVGSANNDPHVDVPNMLSLCELNIAHYRNSADFEDSIWYCGQAQPYATGLDEEFVNAMRESQVYVGSRQILAIPSGETFGFASAPPNPLVRQAMVDKVDMMIGLGARLITMGGVAKTADQTSGEREMLHSPLSLSVNNVSDAYNRCFAWCADYVGATMGEGDGYQISTDFVKPIATTQELQQIIAGFVSGSVPLSDYVKFMQRQGLFDPQKTTEDYSEDLRMIG